MECAKSCRSTHSDAKNASRVVDTVSNGLGVVSGKATDESKGKIFRTVPEVKDALKRVLT